MVTKTRTHEPLFQCDCHVMEAGNGGKVRGARDSLAVIAFMELASHWP